MADTPTDTASKQRAIGSANKPVRAIAFSSGGFDTVMQLGVIHALLVIQGKPPDAVVGVSAGAVNAIALAEVFQAGPDPADWPTLDEADRQQMLTERQRARVLKLRKMLEAYLDAPADLARAFMPDTLQVDARRPLRPLELPIHDLLERQGRGRELQARQGFINLFNDLLGLRVSFATLTRLVRRYLGWQSAAEIRSRPGRMAVRFFELARVWALIAANFPRAATIVARLVRPVFGPGTPRQDEGATAADIIFEPLWLRTLKRTVAQILWPVSLLLIWTGLTLLVLGLPVILLVLLRWGLHRVPAEAKIPALLSITNALDERLAFWALIGYAGLAAIVLLTLVVTGGWRQIVSFNRSTGGAVIGAVVKEGAAILVLLVAGLALPFAVLVGWEMWQGGFDGPLRPSREAVEWLVFWAVVVLVSVVVTGFRVTAPFRRGTDSYIRRLLARYDLADGLLSPHPLKQLFIRLFDPEYYGKRKMDDVVDRSLRDDYSPSVTDPSAKLIRNYESQSPRVAVGLMVANMKTGALENVPDSTKVVDGLLAATAVSPLFPPRPIVDKLYLDGANITSEATSGALRLLHDRIHPQASVVHLYSVSHLPFSRPSLGPAPERNGDAYLNLVDVATRAMQLQRFRDAALERRMTELYTRVIPPGRAVFPVGPDKYLRVWVTPVEPEAPLDLNQRIARCGGPKHTRQIMSEAVADGCRAGLEVMIRASIPERLDNRIQCRQAVQAHLNAAVSGFTPPLLADLDPDNPALAGAPPGLPEVCRHCALARAPAEVVAADRAALRVREWATVGPAWPHELAEEPADPAVVVSDPHFERVRPESETRTMETLSALGESYWKGFSDVGATKQWPRDRRGLMGHDRSLVSLLFSGGVFRGVYQMGTLAAISEAGLVPDVIAGASVGSITGAMVAQALAIPEGAERDGRVARLAATYLAMDRLVLTDRFADFIRGLTLRAAASRFSLQQSDRFFRRYDQAAPAGSTWRHAW